MCLNGRTLGKRKTMKEMEKKTQNVLFSSFYASIRTLRSLGLDELTSKNCRTHTLLIEIEV